MRLSQPVFYAPLSQDDRSDHVSGTSFKNSDVNNGSATWDGGIGAYKFYKASGRGGAVLWNNLDMGINLSTLGITLFFNVMFNAQTTRSPLLGGYVTNNNGIRWNGIINTEFVKTLGVWQKWLFVGNEPTSTGIEIYLNGVYSSSRGNQIVRVRGTGDSFLNTMVSIGTSDTTGSTQATNIYAKNILVWNKALTQEEIEKVFEIF